MAVLLQVLPFVAVLGVAAGLVLLIGRGVTSRRPREDPSLQHHQQSSRSQIGGGGFGM